jgi:hypothetical protein
MMFLHLHFNSAVSVTRSRKVPLTGDKHNALVVTAYDNPTFDKFLRKESKIDFYSDADESYRADAFRGRSSENPHNLRRFFASSASNDHVASRKDTPPSSP